MLPWFSRLAPRSPGFHCNVRWVVRFASLDAFDSESRFDTSPRRLIGLPAVPKMWWI